MTGAAAPGLWHRLRAERALRARRSAQIEALRARFVDQVGYAPDFDRPRTFNEKINHRKIHDRNPLFPRMVDKIEVRRVVAEILGGDEASALFLPVLSSRERPTLAWLERQVARPGPGIAVKANHGSGWNIILRAGQAHDLPAAMRRLSGWMGRVYGADVMEWAYSEVPRRAFAEPLMLWPDGRPADDLKFIVFNGRCALVQIEQDRFGDASQFFFDRDWNPLQLRMNATGTSPYRGLPQGLDRMLAVAEAIGARFDHVRVDFMFTDTATALNELTLYRGSGLNPFRPVEWDRRLGDMWTMRTVPRRWGQA